jgi:hypothetical protein
MSYCFRREMLKRMGILVASGAVGLVLAACGASSSTPPPAQAPTSNPFQPQLTIPAVQTTSSTTTTKKTTSTKKKSGAPSTPAITSTPETQPTTPQTQPTTQPSTSTPSTVTNTVTVTRTIVKTSYLVPGAGARTVLGYLHVTRFTSPGGNVGCEISGGVARCDIANRVWALPRKPKSCHLAWGVGLSVGATGTGQFVCAGDSVLDPNGKYMLDGVVDVVGSIRCIALPASIDCFNASGNGFSIGRTGYYIY